MMEARSFGIDLDGRPLMQGLDFTLEAGRILALAGPSGIGKSLLAASLIGMLPTCARRHGTLALDGVPLCDRQLRAIRGRHIGFAPQPLSSLDPSARIGDQLRWAARRAGLPRLQAAAAVSSAIGRFGLPDDAGALYPHRLSGGMARRVLIAIATIGKPQVLIVDEPTSGLDTASIGRVADDVRRLAAGGCAVLMITHDLFFAAGLADSIAVLTETGFARPMPAALFVSDGAGIPDAEARRLWRAMPANGMVLDA